MHWATQDSKSEAIQSVLTELFRYSTQKCGSAYRFGPNMYKSQNKCEKYGKMWNICLILLFNQWFSQKEEKRKGKKIINFLVLLGRNSWELFPKSDFTFFTRRL
jgi:hypothetical protein